MIGIYSIVCVCHINFMTFMILIGLIAIDLKSRLTATLSGSSSFFQFSLSPSIRVLTYTRVLNNRLEIMLAPTGSCIRCIPIYSFLLLTFILLASKAVVDIQNAYQVSSQNFVSLFPFFISLFPANLTNRWEPFSSSSSCTSAN